MKKKSDLKKLKKLLKKRNIAFEQTDTFSGPYLEVDCNDDHHPQLTFFFTSKKKKLESISYPL